MSPAQQAVEEIAVAHQDHLTGKTSYLQYVSAISAALARVPR